jgi:hypothetical protein
MPPLQTLQTIEVEVEDELEGIVDNLKIMRC